MRKRISLSIFFLSAFFAIITTLEQQNSSIINLAGILMFFLCILIIYYVILNYISQKQKLYLSIPIEHHARLLIKRPFFFFFLILILFWLPYVIFCYPGNIAYDTGTSILHHLGMINNPNNPVFLNYLYGWIYDIGIWLCALDLIVFLCCLFQTLLFALVISKSLVLIESSRTPKSIVYGLLLLYAILPVFPLYAFCLGKDSLLAILMLSFSVLLYECCKEDDTIWSKWKKGGLYATAILLPLVRNYAILIVVLCLLPLVKKKQIIRFPLIVSILTTTTFYLLIPAPKNDVAEILSLPIQQTGYVVTHYEIRDDEKTVINSVLPSSVLANYNPGIADPLKNNFAGNIDAIARQNYYQVWFSQFFRYPIAYVKAFYLLTNGYYTPAILRNDLKPHVFVGYRLSDQVMSDTAFSPNNNRGLSVVLQLDNAYISLPVLGVFQRIGIYTWILFATGVNGFKRKLGLPNICLLPPFLVFLGCCLSPVNAYFRYALPIVLSVPILSILLFFTPKAEFNVNKK